MTHLPDPLLSARFKNIQATVLSHVSKLGLCEYINQFGNLIFGPLRQDIFYRQYNELKTQQIWRQINSSFEDFGEKQNVQFYMHMMHEAQKISTWRWPGLINNVDNLHWVNGNSRLFATGMTKQNPSKLLNFLILQSFSMPMNIWINDPTVVANDDILHTVLNVSQDDEPWVPHCEILLQYDADKYHKTLKLSGIKDPNDFTDQNVAGEDLLVDFLQWQQHYGPSPVLNVYTNWPDLVTNTHNAWDVKIAGTVAGIKANIHRPVDLENQIRWRHDFCPFDSNQHVLFIVEPRPIDVAELLCWVNLKNTTFISSDWSFLLYRPDKQYSNTFVDLSYIPSNK